MEIDQQKFNRLHQVFLEYMAEQSGVPFQAFDHPELVSKETAYKYEAARKGRSALRLKQWPKWRRGSGKILAATREACAPTNSANLLSAPRYGATSGSSGALYRVQTPEEVKGLEEALSHFYLEGSTLPKSFSKRFDSLAEFLRENRLGCNWRLLAYLAFLLQHQIYFPVLPSMFDKLLGYFEIPTRLSGTVVWEAYEVLLELGQGLADELSHFGRPNSIEVQSYMYVVATLLKSLDEGSAPPPPLDLSAELKKRQAHAAERERIGLRGEALVLEAEKQALEAAGRNDLARRVRLVSVDGSASGYDLLSFSPSGDELHLEIKTTTRSRLTDQGFWLSDNERTQAERDSRWQIVRVWDVPGLPEIEALGNIVSDKNDGWRLNATSWFVARIESDSQEDEA